MATKKNNISYRKGSQKTTKNSINTNSLGKQGMPKVTTIPKATSTKAVKKTKIVQPVSAKLDTKTAEKQIAQQKIKYNVARANNDYLGQRTANEEANKIRKQAGIKQYSSAKGDLQHHLNQSKTLSGISQNNVKPIVTKLNQPNPELSLNHPLNRGVKQNAITNTLRQMFDDENYEDKFKRGNVSGGVASAIGETIQLPQTLLLNVSNQLGSLSQGKGLQPYHRKMDFADYEAEIAKRNNGENLTNLLNEKKQGLGTAYSVIMDIASDPLNLLDAGAVMSAKGLSKAGSLKYADELAKGKFTLKNGKQITKIEDLENLTVPKPTINNAIGNKTTPFTVTKGEVKQIPNAIKKPSQATIPNANKKSLVSDLKDLGADTNKNINTMDDAITKYGKMKSGEQLVDANGNPITKEVNVPKGTPYGETQQHARTLLESPIIDDVLGKDIEDEILKGTFTKATKGNKVAVDNANKLIEGDFELAYNTFKGNVKQGRTPTSEDIALGYRLVQELQKTGNYQDALKVAADVSQMLSETGRTLQAARIAKRLSPEGRLLTVSKAAQKMAEKIGKDINISDDLLNNLKNATTEKEITEANQEIFTEIWNQVPPTWFDKLNAWRYMSMLANPKTHIRNIVGNSIFVPVRELKNVIGARLEKTVPVGERTKSILNPLSENDRALRKFASEDFENVKSVLKGESKYDESLRPLESRIFKNKALEKIRSANMNALDAEDTIFMKSAYCDSLAQYMKANKLTVEDMTDAVLDKARKYASDEALKSTYRDANSLAELISKGKRKLANSNKLSYRAGGVLAEGALPFTKTPLNILKRGIEYSPLGLMNGIKKMAYDVGKGTVTATEAIDSLASGMSGTAICALGAFLLDKGLLEPSSENEYYTKEGRYDAMMGEQEYSLNIGDKSYTVDWAAPVCMPLFVGAEIMKQFKGEGFSFSNIADAMTNVSDPMFNLSMLQGINNIVNTGFNKGGIAQIAENMFSGYAGQMIPTVGGQIARTLDTKRRSTTSTKEQSIGKQFEQFKNKQQAKIPLLNQKLEPYVDLWGREENTGNLGKKVFDNFVSPGYLKNKSTDPVDTEIKNLSKNLGSSTLPSKPKYTIDFNGEKIRMTAKELTEYSRTKGLKQYTEIKSLLNSDKFKNMDDGDKTKAIENIYKESNKKAKNDLLIKHGKDEKEVWLHGLGKDAVAGYNKVQNYMSAEEYYNCYKIQKEYSSQLAKAIALADSGNQHSDEVISALGIKQKTIQKANLLRESGISADQYQQIRKDANEEGESLKKIEMLRYLNANNFSDDQKRAILRSM